MLHLFVEIQAPKGECASLDSDLLNEEGPPNLTVVLQCLDTRALDEAWQEISMANSRRYKLFAHGTGQTTDNCSSMLVRLLQAALPRDA